MKILAVSAIYQEVETYRPLLMKRYFAQKGEVTLLTTDFSHALKKKIQYGDPCIVTLPSKPYYKNISIGRLRHYIDFSRQAARRIKTERPSLVYIYAPPNSEAYFCVKAAKKVGATVLLDIIDLWPEALPVGNGFIKTLFLATAGVFWKWFRSWGIQHADYIITESEYFFQKLGLKDQNARVVYLTKAMEAATITPVTKDCVLTFGYIGGINNIVDFEAMISLCKALGKTVRLEIIGEGERRQWLLDQLQTYRIDFLYYGVVFDENEKETIMAHWDFGFNGYKAATQVALSYKSIDYLSRSVPLINSTQGDTWTITERYHCGINYTPNTTEKTAAFLLGLNSKEIANMRQAAKTVFDKYFSYPAFCTAMDEVCSIVKINKENKGKTE